MLLFFGNVCRLRDTHNVPGTQHPVLQHFSSSSVRSSSGTMSRSSLDAAARLFNELATAQGADTWKRLHPAIEATHALLRDAVAACKVPLQAEFNSAQQQLPRAWCAAAAAGLRMVAANASASPGAGPLPCLALQAVCIVVSGFSQLLYHFHGRVVAAGGLQGREAALGMVQLIAGNHNT
jgi:hypothetical protein